MNKTLQTLSIIALTLIMTACASRGGYQPLPPVKVITETVEVEWVERKGGGLFQY